MGVYAGRQWALIEEHLHDALGRQARDAGDRPTAVHHFAAMLASSPLTNLYCQRLYLQQFMDVLQQAQEQLVSGWANWQAEAALQGMGAWGVGMHAALAVCSEVSEVSRACRLNSCPLHCARWSVQGFPPVLELALPVVNRTHVGVQHDGQTCYSGVEARQVLPDAWRALDAALQPQGEANTNGLRLEGDPERSWVCALI